MLTTVITPNDVTDVASEFQGITQERIDAFMPLVEGFVCETAFGNKARSAVLFYLLHLLTKQKQAAGGANGAITSEKVGELSRNYGSGSGSSPEAGDLADTAYGMMFFNLRKGIVITPIIVG